MPDLNPGLMIALAKSNIVGDTETIDRELKPTDQQFALKPGDHAVTIATNSIVDQDFVCIEILDPEQHKEEFPDWEHRLQNSYVLCRWFSAKDVHGGIGWYTRVKLVPITDEQYADVEQRRDQDEGFADEPPDWLYDAYDNYMDALHQREPSKVPAPVSCPHCQSRNTELNITYSVSLSAKAGMLIKNGKEKYVQVTDIEKEESLDAHLFCGDCRAKADLDESEFGFRPPVLHIGH